MKLIIEFNCENVKFSFYESNVPDKHYYKVCVSHRKLLTNKYVNHDYVDITYTDAKQRFLFEIYKYISRELDNNITDLPF